MAGGGDHGHGGGGHGGGGHGGGGHKAGGGGGHGGGGGGGGGGVTLGNMFLGVMAGLGLVIGIPWLSAHPAAANFILFVIESVVFLLLPFWIFRFFWTIPAGQYLGWGIARGVAGMSAVWCLLYLWVQMTGAAWAVNHKPHLTGEVFKVLAMDGAVLAVTVWIGLNVFHALTVESALVWLTGGWGGGHHGGDDHAKGAGGH